MGITHIYSNLVNELYMLHGISYEITNGNSEKTKIFDTTGMMTISLILVDIAT